MTYIIYDPDIATYTTIGDYERRHECTVVTEQDTNADTESDADDGEEGEESHDHE